MFPNTKKYIIIEGKEFSCEEFKKESLPVFMQKSVFHLHLFEFLKDWFSDTDTVEVKTSGSTGEPKVMRVSKQKMINSAELTCNFLELKAHDKALLCLPLEYIAGKMVVIRAITAQLDLHLVEPEGNPLTKTTETDFAFAAMIPLQIYNSLINNAIKLEKIKNIIIGGGTVDAILEKKLQPLTNNIYSSYGMTETLSHIALRCINGMKKSSNYVPFNSVKISLKEDSTLVIEAPLVSDNIIYTNDMAEIFPDGSFSITGRKDNIINSGGIKIQPEVVENLLRPLIDFPFAITSLPDEKLGEIVVLVTENQINPSIFSHLPKYCKPRKIIVTDKIPTTETGKIMRQALKNLLFVNNFSCPS
ncbi:MAG: AMP-binding protein [Tannerella sp.]|jgi:O-succinylbenzoic acid--CoA ligase|nr:AMP-binding protein [Tannerella sp.]